MGLIQIMLVVVGTSIWVSYDARAIGVKKGQIKGFLDMGPTGWFLSCLLMWLVCFPLYLSKRKEYKRINLKRSFAERLGSDTNTNEFVMRGHRRGEDDITEQVFQNQETNSQDLPTPTELQSRNSIKEDSEPLYIGKDEDYSSVYIVSNEFLQEGPKFVVPIRFILLKLGQYFQNIQLYLKDHTCEYDNLTFIEELWAFEPCRNWHSRLKRTYFDSGGKILYESIFEDPKWILLNNVPAKGIVKQVYETVMAQLADIDKLIPEPEIKTSNLMGADLTKIETINFMASVRRVVDQEKVTGYVDVDQIDPVNQRSVTRAYIFLKDGTLNEDLDWRDGEKYCFGAHYFWQNGRGIDFYLIDTLKRYLMQLEKKILGKSVTEIEFIRAFNASFRPKGNTTTNSSQDSSVEINEIFSSPFAIACLALSIIGLFVPVILVYFFIAISVVLGIFSISRKEKFFQVAVLGFLLSLLALIFASLQVNRVNENLDRAIQELNNFQRRFR